MCCNLLNKYFKYHFAESKYFDFWKKVRDIKRISRVVRGISITGTSLQKDIVGNVIQEWLQGWLDKNKIFYSVNKNSQMPPDFFLSEDKTKSLLEVKAFNRSASPGFLCTCERR